LAIQQHQLQPQYSTGGGSSSSSSGRPACRKNGRIAATATDTARCGMQRTPPGDQI